MYKYATDTRNIGNIWKIDTKIHRPGDVVGSVYDILLYCCIYTHSSRGDDRAAIFDKQLTRVSVHPVGRLPVAI